MVLAATSTGLRRRSLLGGRGLAVWLWFERGTNGLHVVFCDCRFDSIDHQFRGGDSGKWCMY